MPDFKHLPDHHIQLGMWVIIRPWCDEPEIDRAMPGIIHHTENDVVSLLWAARTGFNRTHPFCKCPLERPEVFRALGHDNLSVTALY
ncbi:hypothetical protein SRCM100623_00567 [Acetobacter pasteurianus]|uniref:Uncharacterized protein n=1 Tax=Acetobacter pasteurianus TaxID=438 RepID=A0A1A0DJB8_ACEPA|nr:hypothetical protein SRCM100623_00567 [Acetobacter pasteurianus]